LATIDVTVTRASRNPEDAFRAAAIAASDIRTASEAYEAAAQQAAALCMTRKGKIRRAVASGKMRAADVARIVGISRGRVGQSSKVATE
jgi:hypothetical protein